MVDMYVGIVMESPESGESDSEPTVPRGKPKSGRPWKTPKQKYSTIRKVKSLKTSWDTKMKLKKDQQTTVIRTRELKEEVKKAKEDAWKKIAERKKREEANSKKAEIVQPIKNTAKVKRMKRKQLQNIEKR